MKRKFVSFAASEIISGSGKYTCDVYLVDGLENCAPGMFNDDREGDEIIYIPVYQWDK